MTIKSKLTLNVVIVLAVTVTVVLASVIGMGFVKSKLFDLTEKSTPFQTRTMELQRAIHAATADLVKVGAAANPAELKTYRPEAEASLEQVNKAEESVSKLLAGKKNGVYDAVKSQADELFSVTEGRLKMEQAAIGANNEVRGKLQEVSDRLRDLDTKVRSLQSTRSVAYGKSLEKVKGLSSRLRAIDEANQMLKDFQLWCLEVQNLKDKSELEGKLTAGVALVEGIKTTIEKAFKKSDQGDNAIGEGLVDMEKKITAMSAAASSGTPVTDQKLRADLDSLANTFSVVAAVVQTEAGTADSEFSDESTMQATIFSQVGQSITVLNGTSELTSLGLSTEGLATRLFTVNNVKDVDDLRSSLATNFDRIDKAARTLDKTLGDLGAKQERKMLATAVAGISSMKALLFSDDGIVSKVRNEITMKEKAAHAMEGLRSIVLAQAEEAKKTMTTAKGVQEQSIIDVNRMILLSTMLVIVVGLIAVVIGIGFGAWIYRSISKPLGRLIVVTDDIAAGNLHRAIEATAHDEIGRVEASMAKMVANLKEIVGKIRFATESLAS